MIRRKGRTLMICLLILILLCVSMQYIYLTFSIFYLSVFETIYSQSQNNFHMTSDRCFTKAQKKSIRRAIVVHFPVERSSLYLSELKWLYLSWIEAIKNQPIDWQTDLLIYSLPSLLLDELGCYEKKTKASKNNCFRIHYNSLWDKRSTDNELIPLVQTHIPIWCRHLDSIGILLENSNHLNEYDYIMRTDLDIFLTPSFAHYIPYDCSFQIGMFSSYLLY